MDATQTAEPLADSPLTEAAEAAASRTFAILDVTCAYGGATVTVTWKDAAGAYEATTWVDPDADAVWWSTSGTWPDDEEQWDEIAAAAERAYHETADECRMWGDS